MRRKIKDVEDVYRDNHGIGQMEPQVDPSFYLRDAYGSKGQFMSFWHQLDAVLKLNPEEVLEVGVGSGFVSDYLKTKGISIQTMDLDDRLEPDLVGNVTSIPREDNSFDLIACYEVLEHLPYEDFMKALLEIIRVTRKFAVISLPDARWYWGFQIRIPRYQDITTLFSLPRLKNRYHSFDGLHYWEIGKKGYPLNRIVGDIQNAGFTILKTYRAFENPYHRFFILKKARPLGQDLQYYTKSNARCGMNV